MSHNKRRDYNLFILFYYNFAPDFVTVAVKTPMHDIGKLTILNY